MKLAVFEGTPEEIKQVWEGMNPKPEAPMAISTPKNRVKENDEEDEDAEEFASVEFCRAVIGRRYLPDTQKKMYIAAYSAYPEALSHEELRDELDYSAAQMAGFWGAYGRRVTHTENCEYEGELFCGWDDNGFKLSDNLKKAIELEGLVK